MAASQADFTIRKISNRAAVIDIRGEISGQAEAALMAAYAEASQPGILALILNFSDLEYMNSSGIGLLVTLLIRVQRQKQKLLAYGLSDHYRQIFDLTRLDSAIGIYEDEAAASAAVN